MVGNKKKAEFVGLFRKFASTYLSAPDGRRYMDLCDEGRGQARRNFENINVAFSRGEDITEEVLLKLLPYTDSMANRQKEAWIHTAPVISENVKEWFQKSGLTQPDSWPLVAKAVLLFVRRCIEEPRQLSAACADFSELPYCKAFQTEMLSPILSALRPDDFLPFNNKSQQVVNHFADKSYSLRLTDYPAANETGHVLTEEAAKEMRRPHLPEIQKVDLFDMFSHWLVAVKKYDFKRASFTARAEMYTRWPPLW